LLAQLADVLPEGLTIAVLLAPVAGLVLSLLLGKKAVAEKILACFFLYSLVFIAMTSGSELLGAIGWIGFFILGPLVGLLFVILPLRKSNHTDDPGPRGFPVVPHPADPPAGPPSKSIGMSDRHAETVLPPKTIMIKGDGPPQAS
jgi:hypothetical protein